MRLTSKKQGRYLFNTNMEDALFSQLAKRIKAKDSTYMDSPAINKTFISIVNKQSHFNSIEEEGVDLYVVDEHFTWIYILTHEENCGSYFYKP